MDRKKNLLWKIWWLLDKKLQTSTWIKMNLALANITSLNRAVFIAQHTCMSILYVYWMRNVPNDNDWMQQPSRKLKTQPNHTNDKTHCQ